MLFPPSGYISPPCIQSPEKSLIVSLEIFYEKNFQKSYNF